MIVTQPPERIDHFEAPSVFLAGSIEMGAAEDWQVRVTEALKEWGKPVHIMNPRRDDWDSSWEQSIDNLQFKEQVDWELDYLDTTHVIFLYFDPNTKSPISLLELGLHINSGRLIVCCPPGFWRKGNVDIVCTRAGIPVYDTLSVAISGLMGRLDYERSK